MVLAVQRIGTATATVAVIFGQLTMSLLIETWLAGQQHDGVLAGATGGGDMSGPRAVLNLYLREVGYLHEAARAEQ